MKQRALQNNTIPNSLTAPRTLRLGTWCSGLKSIAIALIGLGISYCQVFAADINKAAQAMIMTTNCGLQLIARNPYVMYIFMHVTYIRVSHEELEV